MLQGLANVNDKRYSNANFIVMEQFNRGQVVRLKVGGGGREVDHRSIRGGGRDLAENNTVGKKWDSSTSPSLCNNWSLFIQEVQNSMSSKLFFFKQCRRLQYTHISPVS